MRTVLGFDSWDALYRERAVEDMPWFIPVLDPDLERALVDYALDGARVLDLGTGPGTQAIALAERGAKVTATDISAVAIEQARARAGARGVDLDLRIDDVLDTKLEGNFNLIFDRGCFHALGPEQHSRYVESVTRLLAPGALLALKCLSGAAAGTRRPRCYDAGQLRAVFEPSLELRSIELTVYQGPGASPPPALFAILRSAK